MRRISVSSAMYAPPRPGMRMKRGRLAGAISSSRTVASPLLQLEDQAEPLLGMNGKGWAGSIAWGVRIGKICSRKCWSSQSSPPRRQRLVADHVHASGGQRGLKSAQTSCWLVTSRSASTLIAASCCVGVSPSVETFLDAEQPDAPSAQPRGP